MRVKSMEMLSDRKREIAKIIKKIKTVYDSILKDDFAFEFRNDEELASKNLVYKKYKEL